ncbi:MAG: DMT family transporter [Clostridiales bacterium]|nr:DMT family transporter [Clostridiales bacterium]
MWVIFAVLTVLFWGTSDVLFKSRSVSARENPLWLLAYNGIILGVCSIGYWVITGYRFSFGSLVTYIPVAAVYLASMYFYYRAMPVIELSIASPIANCSCMLTTLLCITILKQPVTWLQAVGIALIFVALIILSKGEPAPNSMTAETRKSYKIGILFALLYFVFDGVGSFLDDYMLGAQLDTEAVIVAYGLLYMVLGLVCAGILLKHGELRGFRPDPICLAGCACETAGQFTYVYTYAAGDAAIASPFIASFCALSVILSRLFLKEKLKAWQYVLVCMMVAGMFLLAIE